MKQKYLIQMGENQDELVIKEFGELDKDMLSLLCEETYTAEMVTAAMAKGKGSLIACLRTQNLFPAMYCAEKIADAVMNLYKSPDSRSVEVLVDDVEFLTQQAEENASLDDIDIELDNMSDDFDDFLDDDDKIKSITSSIKIADDDSVDISEEV